MGGKNNIVIMEKVDFDIVVYFVMMLLFKIIGQCCVFFECIVVYEDVYDEFKECFVENVKNVFVGDLFCEDMFMGFFIEEGYKEKVMNYNEFVEMEGVNVFVDCIEFDVDEIFEGYEDGYWVGLFVYEVDFYDDFCCIYEEVFGFYVVLLKYFGDIEDVVEIQNDIDYGLVGVVIFEDYCQINYFCDYVEVGFVYGNFLCIGVEVYFLFGGVKKFGNGYFLVCEIIEVVIECIVWMFNNFKEICMVQGFLVDIKIK